MALGHFLGAEGQFVAFSIQAVSESIATRRLAVSTNRTKEFSHG
jgi:hypothetical protein